MKMTIDLHEHHYALLEDMATEHYRDARQQAAWLIACAVSASGVVESDEREAVASRKCPAAAQSPQGSNNEP